MSVSVRAVCGILCVRVCGVRFLGVAPDGAGTRYLIHRRVSQRQGTGWQGASLFWGLTFTYFPDFASSTLSSVWLCNGTYMSSLRGE